MDAFAGLQVLNDLEKIVRSRVSLGVKHTHKAFARYLGSF